MEQSLVKQAACSHWSKGTYKEEAESAYQKQECVAITLMARKVSVRSFEAGAEWHAKQSPWIRAKDQLPPVDEEDISAQSEPVLVKISGHCEPEILVYNKYYHVWETSDGDDYSCNISDDDLWMPIPLLPKGGDI